MITINIHNETNRLKSVILGTAQSNGPTPQAKNAYDPKSLEHILAGTYPLEKEMVAEMESFARVLEKYEVKVYRPEIIENYNQIFTRDIGFVIDDFLIKANILPDRDFEFEAIQFVVNQINPNKIKANILPDRDFEFAAIQSVVNQINPDKILIPPPEVHIEGGDVILWNNYVFIGTYKGADYSQIQTARTNIQGVDYIKKMFPDKIVKEFDLIKSTVNARENALHLDCCFQPVGNNKGIIYPNGFINKSDYQYLVNLFGEENLFHITQEEMYWMYSNVFSIAMDVVVSERNFTRLNHWLRSHGFIVEEISYAEISKQEGLLRCSTLPLERV